MIYETLDGKPVIKFEFHGYMFHAHFQDKDWRNRAYHNFRWYVIQTIASLIISKGVEVRNICFIVYGSPKLIDELVNEEKKYILLGDQAYWKFYPKTLFEQTHKPQNYNKN